MPEAAWIVSLCKDVALRLELRDLAAKPSDLQLFGLYLPMAGKGMRRIDRHVPDPFAKHVLVHIKVTGRLRYVTPRSLISFTVSSLDSRLNILRPIVHLRFHHDTLTSCP